MIAATPSSLQVTKPAIRATIPLSLSQKAAPVNNAESRKICAAIDRLSLTSKHLSAAPLVSKPSRGREAVCLPSYSFVGPQSGGDRIRIGLFAGIHGDEQASSYALLEFIKILEHDPSLAAGYHLFFYPICNPSGFHACTRHSQSGKDLNREFWSNSPEPEVRLLEEQILTRKFHGLVSLHSDDTSDGLYGFVKGAVLTRNLLEPALAVAEKILPRNRNDIIDGFAAENGIISKCYDGILTSPPHLQPEPFEIILETPHAAPDALQVKAFIAGLQTILVEYQKLLAFAANL